MKLARFKRRTRARSILVMIHALNEMIVSPQTIGSESYLAGTLSPAARARELAALTQGSQTRPGLYAVAHCACS